MDPWQPMIENDRDHLAGMKILASVVPRSRDLEGVMTAC